MNCTMARGMGWLTGLTFVLVGVGCGEPHTHSHGGGHSHTAPHGGTLVELGEHQYNIEFVRNTEKGLLTAYILDGHAENFVRLPIPSFGVRFDAAGKSESLTLSAVASDKTGEKVGDTSQFEVQSDLLKSAEELKGTVPSIDVRGTPFEGVAFILPATPK